MKNRKADYHQRKDEIKAAISEIYHSHGGIDGYRSIVASISGKEITAEPAKQTLCCVLWSSPKCDGNYIHSELDSSIKQAILKIKMKRDFFAG